MRPLFSHERVIHGVDQRAEGAGQGSGLKRLLEFDPANLTVSVERIGLTDGRLKRSWGDHLNRLVLRSRTAARRDTWGLRLTEDGGKP